MAPSQTSSTATGAVSSAIASGFVFAFLGTGLGSAPSSAGLTTFALVFVVVALVAFVVGFFAASVLVDLRVCVAVLVFVAMFVPFVFAASGKHTRDNPHVPCVLNNIKRNEASFPSQFPSFFRRVAVGLLGLPLRQECVNCCHSKHSQFCRIVAATDHCRRYDDRKAKVSAKSKESAGWKKGWRRKKVTRSGRYL